MELRVNDAGSRGLALDQLLRLLLLVLVKPTWGFPKIGDPNIAP